MENEVLAEAEHTTKYTRNTSSIQSRIPGGKECNGGEAKGCCVGSVVNVGIKRSEEYREEKKLLQRKLSNGNVE